MNKTVRFFFGVKACYKLLGAHGIDQSVNQIRKEVKLLDQFTEFPTVQCNE